MWLARRFSSLQEAILVVQDRCRSPHEVRAPVNIHEAETHRQNRSRRFGIPTDVVPLGALTSCGLPPRISRAFQNHLARKVCIRWRPRYGAASTDISGSGLATTPLYQHLSIRFHAMPLSHLPSGRRQFSPAFVPPKARRVRDLSGHLRLLVHSRVAHTIRGSLRRPHAAFGR